MITYLKQQIEKQSLAFKLSLSIFVCLFVVFTILVFFLSNQSENVVGAKTEELGQKSVQSYVADITHLASETEHLVLNTKNMLSQLEADDVNTFKLVLNSTIKTLYFSELTFTDAWVYVFLPEDVSTGTLYRVADLEGNISFQQESLNNLYNLFLWFKSVHKAEEIYWSEPYTDKISGKTVVTCLVPFMFNKSKDFDGLVAITVDLSQMTESISKFSFAETGKLLLISNKGLYISHPDPRISLKLTIFELANLIEMPELADAGRRVLAGRTGTTTISSSSVFNGPVVFFYAPVPIFKWGLFLVYNEKELAKPIKNVKYLMVMPLLIAMFILFFFIYRICHNATRKLLRLSFIASKYGQGDFSNTLDDIQSADEIGILAKAMSDMRFNLLNYIEKERAEVKEKQKVESELLIAQNIQKSALSTNYPKHDAFQISTRMVPARQVGGDFYDFFFTDRSHFAIVAADVAGKGIPAALYMMKAQTLIKNITKEKHDLSEVFFQVNNELYEGNDNCMFVSAFVAVINIFSGEVEYINAGHTHPLIDSGHGYTFLKPETNVVLGVCKNFHFKAQTLKMQKNDRIFLYTDGVTEAENEQSKFFGEKGLAKALSKKFVSPEQTLKAVLENIQHFIGNAPQSDDITMLEFRFYGINGDLLVTDAKNENLVQIIEFLKQDMTKHKIHPNPQFKLITAAEEIFSNIASYAYPNTPNGTVEIITNADKEKNTYMAAFIDAGQKYNPLERKDPVITANLKHRKIGGLGIYIVKKFSDELEYFYDNNHNILKITIINKA